ncbi:MAG: ATP-binding protein [Cyclobacteriaceae bacterium]
MLLATVNTQAASPYLVRHAGEPLYEIHLRIDSLNAFLADSPDFYYQYPDSALQLAGELAHFSDSIMYVKGTAKAAANLATIAYIRGEYARSLENFFVAFDKYDLLGEEVPLGKTLAWISWLNNKVGRPEKAQEYQKVASALLEDPDSVATEGNAISLFLQAAIAMEQENLTSADSLLNKSITYLPEDSHLKGEALVMQQHLYKKRGLSEEAKNLATDQVARYAKSQVQLTIGQASILANENKRQQAVDLLKATLQEAERVSLYMEIRIILKSLSDILGDMGRDDEAYTYIDRYYSMDQELRGRDIPILFQEMDYMFGNKALEKQVQLLKRRQIILEQQAQINELKLQNSRMMSVFLSLLIGLCLFIVYQSYKRYQLKSKINKELQQQNTKIRNQRDQIEKQRDEISQQKEIIEGQNKELVTTNQALEERVLERTNKLKKAYKDLKHFNIELDTFIYKAYHDIRGPLTSMKGLCNLGLTHVEDKTALEYIREMDTVSTRMNDLMNSMLKITEIKDKTIRKEEVEIKDIVNKLISPYQNNGRKVSFNCDLKTEDICTDHELLETILESVVKNAVQYSYDIDGTPSNIKISSEEKAGNYIVRIEDDGIGIPEDVSQRIFDMFYRGTTSSDGFGLGLYTARVAARRLKGDLRYAKTPKGTTEFRVEIPSY